MKKKNRNGCTLACITSGSAQVRRENWNESKKGMKGEGEGSKGTNFRTIRLETLATQASCTLKAVFNNKSRVIPIT